VFSASTINARMTLTVDNINASKRGAP